MLEFLKVVWENLQGGPVTEPFPFGEAAATPKRLRGRVHINPELCVGCQTCIHVCVARAIKFNKHSDGFDVVVWNNTCCLCGQCAHYCPTKAITLSNDWHTAHRNKDKFTFVSIGKVQYDKCAECGKAIRILPQAVLDKIYANHPEIDIAHISKLCPECRRMELAKSRKPLAPEPKPAPVVEKPAEAPKPSTPVLEMSVEKGAEAAPDPIVIETPPVSEPVKAQKDEQATLVEKSEEKHAANKVVAKIADHEPAAKEKSGNGKSKRNNKRSRRSE